MGCAVLNNRRITITDETTQVEHLAHMTDLGITYKTAAFYMILVVVIGNVLKIGTTNKLLKLKCYQQA
jgi:hypothetical protein